MLKQLIITGALLHLWYSKSPLVTSLTITLSENDAIVGRPVSLERRVNRTSKNQAVRWDIMPVPIPTIYYTRECKPSISLDFFILHVLHSFTDLNVSGGCHVDNGLEVHTIRIQNVTENIGNYNWECSYNGKHADIRLDPKVTVNSVTLTNLPDSVLATVPFTFTCQTPASKPQACIRVYLKKSKTTQQVHSTACEQETNRKIPTTKVFTLTPSVEDNGAMVYCNASNNVTHPPVQSQLHRLNVQYPPVSDVILSGYANTPLEVGSTVSLTCDVGKGNPPPKLTWLTGCGPGGGVNTGRSQEIVINITASPSLNHESCVCKGVQAGALTGWSQQTARTFIALFGPDSVQLRQADFEVSGDKVRVIEKSTVTFTCTSGESNPRAVLVWYYNNIIIPASKLSEVTSERGRYLGHVIGQRYSLLVNLDHYGDVITCNAHRTGQAVFVTSSLTIDIQYAPKITCSTRKWIVFEGQRLRIACEIISKPKADVTWSDNGRIINDTITRVVSSSHNESDEMVTSVEIGSVDENNSGRLHLMSQNRFGSTQVDITIIVIGRDSIPKELQITSCENNEASFTWASGLDKALVNRYFLEYIGRDTIWKLQIIPNPGGVKLLSTTVRGLESGVLYQFRLRPESTVPLLEYATANCSLPDTAGSGLSTAAAVVVGIITVLVIITAAGVSITCWLIRKGKLLWKKGIPEIPRNETSNRDAAQSGSYEDLHLRPCSGQHYEVMPVQTARPVQSTEHIHGNVSFDGVIRDI